MPGHGSRPPHRRVWFPSCRVRRPDPPGPLASASPPAILIPPPSCGPASVYTGGSLPFQPQQETPLPAWCPEANRFHPHMGQNRPLSLAMFGPNENLQTDAQVHTAAPQTAPKAAREPSGWGTALLVLPEPRRPGAGRPGWCHLRGHGPRGHQGSGASPRRTESAGRGF